MKLDKAHIGVLRFVKPIFCGVATIAFTLIIDSLPGAAQDLRSSSSEPAAKSVAGGELERKIPLKNLEIGDKVPDDVWNLPLQVVNHPDQKETVTLKEYQGKLIILDFWATWCTSCIRAMNRTHHLESQFYNQLVILPVTYEEKAKIDSFLVSNKTMRALNLSSVVADTSLNRLFPHRFLPHYVWILSDGTVGAFTSSTELNAASINAMTSDSSTNIQYKIDIDPDRPLFSGGQMPLNQLGFYSILIEGGYSGLPTGVRYRTNESLTIGIALTNSTLLYMYQIVARNLLSGPSEKKVIVKSEKPELTGLSGKYSYELQVPVQMADGLYLTMLNQLNTYTDFTAEIATERIKCMVLSRVRNSRTLKTRGGEFLNRLEDTRRLRLRNAPMLALVGRLNNEIPLLVIDETGIGYNIDLKLQSPISNIAAVSLELQKMGLQLSEAERDLKVLVIEED